MLTWYRIAGTVGWLWLPQRLSRYARGLARRDDPLLETYRSE